MVILSRLFRIAAMAVMLFGLGAVGCAASAPPPLAPLEACEAADPVVVAASAVLIEVNVDPLFAKDGEAFGRGAGVVLDREGRVLTALHVVARASAIRAVTVIVDSAGVMHQTGRVVPMRIAAGAPEYDAALLVPRYPQWPLMATPATLAPRQAREGELIFGLMAVSGWRLGEVEHVDFPMPDLETIVESTITSRLGDSGSPLVDRCGRVVGFMCRGYPGGNSFFMPALPVLRALENRRP